MRWMILAVLVLVGCDLPTRAAAPERIVDDPWMSQVYVAVEHCLDQKGWAGLVQWLGDPDAAFVLWEAPHFLTVPVFDGAPTVAVVRDGALRDILQTNDVPSDLREACG